MTRLAIPFLSLAMMAAGAGPSRTFTGVITDTMCGNDHKAMNIAPLEKCVRECIKHDKSTKYALLSGSNLYVLSDQQTPEKFAGRKVKVTGILYEKTNIIKVEGIEAAK
jgi:hypothetical protein